MKIRKILLDLGIVELIIGQIIEYQDNPDHCSHFIELAVEMLASEEEGQIVQKKFYDHMVAD